MSLYHEAAEILGMWSTHSGGSLKSRVFKRGHEGKVPPAQLYALVVESSKWSGVLREVIEGAELLKLERKLTPALSLLLVHDLLLSKKGIALPQSHGLRSCVERHKGRLGSQLTLARVRRKMHSVEALRELVEREAAGEEAGYPRWVRVNALKSTLEEQLATTFAGHERASSVAEVVAGVKRIYIDAHVPNLVAVSPGTDLSRTKAYKEGRIILQDKASCFPAYLLDPEGRDVIDACAAPGNKTTHLAAILHVKGAGSTIYAFEKDARRAQTLGKMVDVAGSKEVTKIGAGQDFLQVDPEGEEYANVGALLLDPSCSGSGIVGRDSLPSLRLPAVDRAASSARKRRRGEEESVIRDDEGNETVVGSEKELAARLEALAAFQLTLLTHAFKFPAARRITYSTCSTHSEENEQVVMRALRSETAQSRGWRILTRAEQVDGMKAWGVRGVLEAAEGEGGVAEGCVRSYKGDGNGVMGFFVAGFVRDGPDEQAEQAEPEEWRGFDD